MVLFFSFDFESDCISLGEEGNSIEGDSCCEGLVEVGLCLPEENGSCGCIISGNICLPYGNGNCESWENKCNCPDDCE